MSAIFYIQFLIFFRNFFCKKNKTNIFRANIFFQNSGSHCFCVLVCDKNVFTLIKIKWRLISPYSKEACILNLALLSAWYLISWKYHMKINDLLIPCWHLYSAMCINPISDMPNGRCRNNSHILKLSPFQSWFNLQCSLRLC